jgi:hypothetical protein
MNSKIFYTKNANDPLNGLHIVNLNFGWVEYLQQHGQTIFYASGITNGLNQQWQQQVKQSLSNNFHTRNSPFFGLLKKLVQTRTNTNFSMPLFATGNNSVLTCGSTRFIAHSICHSPVDQIATVFQLKSGERLPSGVDAVQIQSTDHFNSLAGLNDTNYTIEFSTSGEPLVSTSLIHQLDYQLAGQSNLINFGNSIFDFWQRFVQDNRIKITVSCADPKQISYDPEIWDPEILYLPENIFGYGAIMKKFQESNDEKLHLWINGNFHLTLEHLLVWPDNRGSCWWHTQDKNLHLFETTAGPQSVHRSISIIGNIVK